MGLQTNLGRFVPMALTATQRARRALARLQNQNQQQRQLVVVPRAGPVVQARAVNVPQNVQIVRQPRRRRRNRGNRNNGSGYQSRVPVSLPSNMGNIFVARNPRYGGAVGELTVEHEEVLYNVSGGDFNTKRVPMFPAQMAWLSGLAANFSQWSWESVECYYSSVVGTGVNGEVMMGWMYDFDRVPNSAIEAQSLHNNIVTPPYSAECVRTTVDTRKFGKARYPFMSESQYNNVNDNSELVGYIPAWLVIASNASVSGLIGRVRIRYRVRLMDPIPARMNTDPADATESRLALGPEGDTTTIVQDPVVRLAAEIRGLLPDVSVTTSLPTIPVDPPVSLGSIVSQVNVGGGTSSQMSGSELSRLVRQLKEVWLRDEDVDSDQEDDSKSEPEAKGHGRTESTATASKQRGESPD